MPNNFLSFASPKERNKEKATLGPVLRGPKGGQTLLTHALIVDMALVFVRTAARLSLSTLVPFLFGHSTLYRLPDEKGAIKSSSDGANWAQSVTSHR